jgi:drug/metabolite transporter (DMT)-like permease
MSLASREGSMLAPLAPAAPREHRTQASAGVGLFIALVGVSLSAIFIKLAASPPLTIATNRMLAALLLLLVPILGGGWHGLARIQARDMGGLAVSGISLGVHFGLWTLSLAYTSVASSVVFVSTYPVCVAVVEWLWLGQRLPRAGWLGVALTLVGGVLIGWNDLITGAGDTQRLLGDGLALAGGAALVGYLIIGRQLRQHLDIWTYSVPVYGVAWLVLLGWTSATGGDVRAFPPTDLVWFVALAVCSTLAGHTVLNWALRHVSASLVAVTMVGEPIGAALLAWLILGQPVGPLTALGGAVILGGIWLTARAV